MKITSKTVKPMNVRSRKQTGPATAHWRRTSKRVGDRVKLVHRTRNTGFVVSSASQLTTTVFQHVKTERPVTGTFYFLNSTTTTMLL